MKKIMLVLIVIMWLQSCQEKNAFKADPFKREILPLGNKGIELFNVVKSIRDSLKLDTLENGFDSLQIRLWFGWSNKTKQQVIIIKKSAGHWNASLINFEPILYEKDAYQKNVYRADSVLYVKHDIITKTPKKNWEDFATMLYQERIMDLPDQSQIKNYYISSEPGGVTIEIATKKMYRIYSYHSTTKNLNIREAQNINRIVKIISDQLNIQLLFNGI